MKATQVTKKITSYILLQIIFLFIFVGGILGFPEILNHNLKIAIQKRYEFQKYLSENEILDPLSKEECDKRKSLFFEFVKFSQLEYSHQNSSNNLHSNDDVLATYLKHPSNQILGNSTFTSLDEFWFEKRICRKASQYFENIFNYKSMNWPFLIDNSLLPKSSKQFDLDDGFFEAAVDSALELQFHQIALDYIWHRYTGEPYQNATFNSLLGALKVSRSRELLSAQEKLKELKDGLTLLDQSVNLSPSNISLRIRRYNILVHIPYFFRDQETIDLDSKFIRSHYGH